MKRLASILIILAACNSPEDKEFFEQSVKIHEEALSKSTETEGNIRNIEESLATCDESVQKVLLDSVRVLKEDLEYWQSTVTEVPGHEHEHEHDHDEHGHSHDHDHVKQTNLTPEMMLEIQKDLKIRIMEINVRSQELLDSVEQCETQASHD